MASSRTITSRLSPRLSSLSPNHLTKPSPSLSQLPSFARVPHSISRVVRLPVELTGATSLMPLHSAIASSLMQSSLAVESWRWGLVPQECGELVYLASDAVPLPVLHLTSDMCLCWDCLLVDAFMTFCCCCPVDDAEVFC